VHSQSANQPTTALEETITHLRWHWRASEVRHSSSTAEQPVFVVADSQI